MSVTLKDVAKLANVTPTVVSRVLHNRASTVRVSPATAERVRHAARQLGYSVNVMARNFRDRRTMTLGVLNGRGMTRPILAHGPRYFATLMDGVIDQAFQHGYSVTLCPQLLGERPEEGISDGRFDGLLWYSIAPTPEILAVLEGCRVPLVIIHAHAEAFGNRWPTVIADNDLGLSLAIAHLIELGHSRIGFALDQDNPNVESDERLAMFHRNMVQAGLNVRPSDVVRIGGDRSELHRYLSGNTLEHSALIVDADGIAAEFVVAAQEHGHNVPADLAIIGFDSTDFCNEVRPTLTSISQPLFELGASATRQLLRLVRGEPVDPPELVIPCGLDIRGSTYTSPSRCL